MISSLPLACSIQLEEESSKFFITILWLFQKKFCISVQTQIQIHLVRLIWTILLIVAAFFGIRTSYVILVPVAFHAFILIVFHILQIHRSGKLLYSTSQFYLQWCYYSESLANLLRSFNVDTASQLFLSGKLAVCVCGAYLWTDWEWH